MLQSKYWAHNSITPLGLCKYLKWIPCLKAYTNWQTWGNVCYILNKLEKIDNETLNTVLFIPVKR